MATTEPRSRCGILYIDDEEKSLKYFRLAFGEKYPIFTALSGEEGLDTLRREHERIGILVSDQRMPEMKGADVLGVARQEFPNVVRILTTAYSNLEDAIAAVNKGHIYQYVVKPWDTTELGMVLQRAADFFHVVSERDELLALKMSTLQRILCGDRVRWLLLNASATRLRALATLIDALPDTMRPTAPRTHVDFQLGSLLAREYANAAAISDILARSEDLSNDLAATLQAFTEAVKNTQSAEIRFDAGTNGVAEIFIQTAGGFEKSWKAVQGIFSLLVQRETEPRGVWFLRVLESLALAKRPLRLEIRSAEGPGDPFQFRFATDAAEPISPEQVLGRLQERFSAWDIARL